jgi:YVTN family beta-propeller protein
MYVASQAAGTVTVTNPSASKITVTVTAGDSPYGIAVSPDSSMTPGQAAAPGRARSTDSTMRRARLPGRSLGHPQATAGLA